MTSPKKVIPNNIYNYHIVAKLKNFSSHLQFIKYTSAAFGVKQYIISVDM